ncbi:hypothetical protein EYF80_028907 [Liparis tanakae]|uniref:Uncharacterized protein n=1 Tax=Liparis tanakae TaxID=230148 RepID=A0A4Z2H825_9TELE|nr:hypothetical protein EYF80_028907 [Liparis tanakae]
MVQVFFGAGLWEKAERQGVEQNSSSSEPPGRILVKPDDLIQVHQNLLQIQQRPVHQSTSPQRTNTEEVQSAVKSLAEIMSTWSRGHPVNEDHLVQRPPS